MTSDPDILDHHERLRGPFLAALALHAALIGGLTLSSYLSSHTSFGALNAGGSAVGVQAVNSIPLVHHGMQNPLANDTESQVPQTPAKPVQREKAEKPPPDAVQLKVKKAKKLPAEVASERQRYRPFNQLEPNQVTSSLAPQVSSPLYSALPGAGRIGTGPNSTIGNLFPAYAAQIQQIIARNWRTGDVNLQTGPTVIVTFELMRNGTIRNIQLLQRSGNAALDNSVQRAVLDSNPLPPIPSGGGFNRDSASVEFWFELKK